MSIDQLPISKCMNRCRAVYATSNYTWTFEIHYSKLDIHKTGFILQITVDIIKQSYPSLSKFELGLREERNKPLHQATILGHSKFAIRNWIFLQVVLAPVDLCHELFFKASPCRWGSPRATSIGKAGLFPAAVAIVVIL